MSQYNKLLNENHGKKDPYSKYLGYKLRVEMNQLYNELNDSGLHFIRCIKPNELKQKNIWNSKLVLL